MPEPNTVDTNNEPTLDQFNQTGTEPDAGKSATADGTSTAAASDATPAGEPAAGQAAQQPAAKEPTPAQPADPYANVLSGLQIPQGVSADENLFEGLKAVAKQYNMPVEAVKALMQLDMNNAAADNRVEEKLLADAQARWAQENQAKYGDNLKNVETNCSRVLAELDKDGKFKELLATAGVSGHPATLGFLKTIGDLYLEKSSVNPNATVSTDEEVELENFN